MFTNNLYLFTSLASQSIQHYFQSLHTWTQCDKGSPPELPLGIIKLMWFYYPLLSGLADKTARIIICVAFNAIRVSDVPRSLLQSSARVLGLKDTKRDKSYLIKFVAEGLLDKGYMKIRDSNPNPTRDDIIKIKPF